MKDIIIVGAGGFGREVAWLIERTKKFNILGFVDDNEIVDTNEYKYLGKTSFFEGYTKNVAIAIAVGSPAVRKQIYKLVSGKENLTFPNLIDPDAIMGDRVAMGIGNIICANSVFTVDIELGDFNLINLNSTVGHDVKIASFNSIYPSVNLSGYVVLAGEVEVGTGCQIIPGVKVQENVTIGAGSVVTKDIVPNSVVVGAPARIIRIKE